ncbi:MAG: single-stranded DNA-binding protein [Acidobacteriaceae bacterium]|nr:single-stranded DNA-binding protein [Acidobacteriaceae bacterium]
MRTLTGPGGFRLKYRITAGAGAADPDGFERRDIYVECKGPDAELMLERDGELLRSLEHVAAKALRLEPEEHDRISFDADSFKAERAASLRRMADDAIAMVKDTEKPYSFPPMNSRERRMLHMFLKDSGLQTASSGEGARRFVMLYPEGARIPREDSRGSGGSSFGDRRGGRSGGGRPSGGRGGDRRGGGNRSGGGGRGRY